MADKPWVPATSLLAGTLERFGIKPKFIREASLKEKARVEISRMFLDKADLITVQALHDKNLRLEVRDTYLAQQLRLRTYELIERLDNEIETLTIFTR